MSKYSMNSYLIRGIDSEAVRCRVRICREGFSMRRLIVVGIVYRRIRSGACTAPEIESLARYFKAGVAVWLNPYVSNLAVRSVWLPRMVSRVSRWGRLRLSNAAYCAG